MSRTWILTGSPENHAATAAHGFAVIGQIRPVSERDATVLMQRRGARARAA